MSKMSKKEVPKVFDVKDRHLGFTAIIPQRNDPFGGYNTLWRSTTYLKDRDWEHAELVSVDDKPTGCNSDKPNSIRAVYKVKGYKYRIAVWFSLKDGERIL